jgi:hypothetical protein
MLPQGTYWHSLDWSGLRVYLQDSTDRQGINRWSWGLDFSHRASQGLLMLQFPLCALFLPFFACTAFLWWLDRKPKPGHCPRCRYDLSATPPSAPCPECGEGGRAQQSPNAEAADPAARTTP